MSIRTFAFLAAVIGAVGLPAAALAQIGPNGLVPMQPQPPAASEIEVDLELVLAVDISGSMSYEEQVLQRLGYIEALEHPEVMSAIRGGLTGKIAVTVVQWAGIGLHHIVVPWTLVEDETTVRQITAILRASPLFELRGTSISDSILYTSSLFYDNGFAGFRNVIDVSGDGANNQGMPVVRAREIALSRNVTINGLPIMRENAGQLGGTGYGLDVYYEDCVIGGPGSFIVRVDGQDNFAQAIRRKLVLEIAGLTPDPPSSGIIPVQAVAPRIDCLIGERLRGYFP